MTRAPNCWRTEPEESKYWTPRTGHQTTATRAKLQNIQSPNIIRDREPNRCKSDIIQNYYIKYLDIKPVDTSD